MTKAPQETLGPLRGPLSHLLTARSFPAIEWPNNLGAILIAVPILLRDKAVVQPIGFKLMILKKRSVRLSLQLLVVGEALVLGSVAVCAQIPPAPELPRPSVDVPGIKPEVLSRTVVPGAPWKVAIATRVTYEPGARVRKHYHTSQVVFYILEGAMVVQDEGKEPVTLKPGDSLLIKPGTVHAHWNASTTGKLVFTEFILVDEGQRSVVFTEQ